MKINKNQKATFAGGCFWCTEAIFNRLKGIDSPPLDKIKEEYCLSQGINLLVIPYWEKDNIEQILTNYLFS